MMYQSRAASIFNNTMTMQNDGVALYHCDSVSLHNNNFSWNTSYGIRMFWTDTCHIYQNNCAHINRPLTDPSDCGAILLIVSNNNIVEHNDLSYSGDGIFLGQYQHSNIPNNNCFAWNECSYSPHNAIEATFAGGNVYRHNSCNYSAYGFWLGYSFNSVVDSNDTLWFWVRTIKQPQYGFQYFTIRVGDDHGDYYKYTASPSLLNAANLSWKQYRFPLAGNTQFTRSMAGTMSLEQVNYIEFRPDTWDYGFTMWVDGVQFHPCTC
ncbi:MAG: right-handed parallel beta-helix repeat-containing protein [Bacteroidota bacterium]